MARHAERELRGWLYRGSSPAGGEEDLVAALQAAAGEVEDRFRMSVELVTVGTCQLGERARAVVGAASEALTNAAKHADVTRVSMFAEVADGQVVVVVRDRGRGFDQAVAGGLRWPRHPRLDPGADAAPGRAGRDPHEPGDGTEVELRMPVTRP